MSDEPIRSSSHPWIKRVGAALAGREAGVLVLEGDRLVEEARAAELDFEAVLVAESRRGRASELLAAGLAVRLVDDALLQRKSSLKTSPGVLALARTPAWAELASLAAAAPDALVLVAAGLANPGNLGALARAAEAAGAAALVTFEGQVSPWNEKALRGSMGSLLRLPVLRFTHADAAARGLGELGFRQAVAATRGGTPMADFDWSGRVALWIAGEARGTGLSDELARSSEPVTVPMAGRVESLNATVAAALLLFAAGRAG